MNPNFPYPKGSVWRKWDLQTQTILDDDYVSLSQYADELKLVEPVLWAEYIAKVGGETNAILFDSKDYFNNGSIPKTDRCSNYVKNFFAFVETFNPDLSCIGITDHNYFDDTLIDTFFNYAKTMQPISGALENTFELTQVQEPAILLRKGIRQHVCEILEGGQEAFQKREQKYNFPQ
jgi:hypothetical protein